MRIHTSLVNTLVWVSGLALNAFVSRVSEGKLFGTAIATHISISRVTIDELLFRELVDVAIGNEANTLHGADG